MISVPLIGDFVFNTSFSMRGLSKISVPLIGDFVFNTADVETYGEQFEKISVPLIGDFVFNLKRTVSNSKTQRQTFPSP